MFRNIFYCVMVVCVGVTQVMRLHAEDVIHANPLDVSVNGRVVDSSDGLFRVFPQEFDLDLNHDGVSDLRFRHTLMPRSERIDSEAFQLMRFAEQGIDSALDIVLGLRSLAVQGLNEGVNDHQALTRMQTQVENGLLSIDRIAERTNASNQSVLDGSFGRSVVASSSQIMPINATVHTATESHTINVITPSERANIEAGTSQSAVLAQDETLVVNDISIDLYQNMTQAQVVDRINDFSVHTGVLADQNGSGGSTRLYSQEFGSRSSLSVFSNRVADVRSSGFGTTSLLDNGVDIQLEINSNSYSGTGSTVLATSGPEKGLAIRVREDPANAVTTATGVLGWVDVADAAPTFVTNEQSGESTSYLIPNIRTEALGLGVPGNQLVGLHEISLLNARLANESLSIIDQVLQDLRSQQTNIADFIAFNALPYGIASVEGLDDAGYATGEFRLLPAGVEIGPNLNFEEDKLELQNSQFFREIEQAGFVGARIPVPEGWIYGWIGVEINGDSSLEISDYAWNSLPNQTVITGVASDRTFTSLLRGDANLDGIVGFQDFLICSSNFGQRGRWHDGDFNFDQQVDFNDFLELSTNFGFSAASVSVPEPTAFGLLSLVSTIVGFVRARRSPL